MSDTSYQDILDQDGAARLKRNAVLAAVLFGVFVALWVTGTLDAQRFADAWPAITQLSSEMFPPDFSRFQTWIKPLVDTVAMSIAGTALAVLFSLPLALLSARNTTPNLVVYQVARFLLNLLRSIPELIMGIIFVAMVGFGALPGVLALGLHSIGMVGKFFAESNRTCRRKADRGRACRRGDAVPGDLACRPAAGHAAAGRYHDLSLGIQFPRLDRARRRRRGRDRFRTHRRAACS